MLYRLGMIAYQHIVLTKEMFEFCNYSFAYLAKKVTVGKVNQWVLRRVFIVPSASLSITLGCVFESHPCTSQRANKKIKLDCGVSILVFLLFWTKKKLQHTLQLRGGFFWGGVAPFPPFFNCPYLFLLESFRLPFGLVLGWSPHGGVFIHGAALVCGGHRNFHSTHW